MVWMGAAWPPPPPPRPWAETPVAQTKDSAIARSDVVRMAGILLHRGSGIGDRGSGIGDRGSGIVGAGSLVATAFNSGRHSIACKRTSQSLRTCLNVALHEEAVMSDIRGFRGLEAWRV